MNILIETSTKNNKMQKHRKHKIQKMNFRFGNFELSEFPFLCDRCGQNAHPATLGGSREGPAGNFGRVLDHFFATGVSKTRIRQLWEGPAGNFGRVPTNNAKNRKTKMPKTNSGSATLHYRNFRFLNFRNFR
jgi:hypothetical protein